MLIQGGTAVTMLVKTEFIPVNLVSMGIIKRGESEAMEHVIRMWSDPLIWFA